jgi:hypothetical protein
MGCEARWMAARRIYREQIECDVEQFMQEMEWRKEPSLSAGIFSCHEQLSHEQIGKDTAFSRAD